MTGQAGGEAGVDRFGQGDARDTFANGWVHRGELLVRAVDEGADGLGVGDGGRGVGDDVGDGGVNLRDSGLIKALGRGDDVGGGRVRSAGRRDGFGGSCATGGQKIAGGAKAGAK